MTNHQDILVEQEQSLPLEEKEISASQQPNSSPYQCKLCPKSFTRFTHLTRHTMRHTDERPHECQWEGCNKKFLRSDEFVRHCRIHERQENSRRRKMLYMQNPYLIPHHAITYIFTESSGIKQCPSSGCTRTFTRLGNLSNYMKKCLFRKLNNNTADVLDENNMFDLPLSLVSTCYSEGYTSSYSDSEEHGSPILRGYSITFTPFDQNVTDYVVLHLKLRDIIDSADQARLY
ncbi:10869_t:CDS:2 [Ambispora gerdemannii]|uniref:Wilms tumor protein homolog n=1 Tax=Ambispora gerdemannii TaxID=144530 RepID=A0A9N9AR26_9GLOM|nr:10869_t:CDS:2 [Ambispora gerdemannii]